MVLLSGVRRFLLPKKLCVWCYVSCPGHYLNQQETNYLQKDCIVLSSNVSRCPLPKKPSAWCQMSHIVHHSQGIKQKLNVFTKRLYSSSDSSRFLLPKMPCCTWCHMSHVQLNQTETNLFAKGLHTCISYTLFSTLWPATIHYTVLLMFTSMTTPEPRVTAQIK